MPFRIITLMPNNSIKKPKKSAKNTLFLEKTKEKNKTQKREKNRGGLPYPNCHQQAIEN